MTARILPLTRGRFAIVDQSEYDWLSQQDWHFVPVRRQVLYGYSRSRQRYMHRALMQRWGQLKPGLVVDHRNCYGTDNRYDNLHAVTKQENSIRHRGYTTNQTGFRGVTKCAHTDRFYAYIHAGEQNDHGHMRIIHLGTYKTFDEAVAARRNAEQQLGITHFDEIDARRTKLEAELEEFVRRGDLIINPHQNDGLLESKYLHPGE